MPEQNDKQTKEVGLDEKYEDLEGITEKKLNIGLWYVERKRKLRLALIIFLVLLGSVSWAYTIYGFCYYLYRGMEEDEKLAVQIAKIGAVGHEYVSTVAPADLEFYPPQILKSGERKYDFFVQISNANKKHWAEFEYYFLADGRETARREGFILPEESKFLMDLGEEFNYKPANVQFKAVNLVWRKIDPHKISDWQEFKNSRLNIAVSDTEFIPARASELSEKINLNNLKFNSANNTAYNYWDAGFIILLYGGSNIIGVNKYTLAEFMSGQNRRIELSWPGVLAQVSKASVIPEINIMDDNVYIKYEGGAGEEK